MLGVSQASWDQGRTPMKSSTNANLGTSSMANSVNRRSAMGMSSARANRQMGQPSSSRGPLKDLRPIRDVQWQKNAQMDIYDYLMEVKADNEMSWLTPQILLRGPPFKQFEEIWKFLVCELDPDWSTEKPVAEEFVIVMKDLGYPFADSITKSTLSAINSPHSWAQITAALHWLVRTARVRAVRPQISCSY
jgi:kinetochore protein NDC80